MVVGRHGVTGGDQCHHLGGAHERRKQQEGFVEELGRFEPHKRRSTERGEIKQRCVSSASTSKENEKS